MILVKQCNKYWSKNACKSCWDANEMEQSLEKSEKIAAAASLSGKHSGPASMES